MQNTTPIPAPARWLGYGGLLPFAALAGSFLAGGPLFPGFALQAFLVYAATILAFVGGVRWGAAVVSGEGLARELALSVVPALWAAGALLLPRPDHSVAALAAGFLTFGIVDRLVAYPGAPSWMSRLRLQLSLGAALCHVALWVGLQ